MAHDEIGLNVDVDHSAGVQAGSGNTQINNWRPKSQLDDASLGALNPDVAVARLQLLSHDELVDFFASANPVNVREILETFLYADDQIVVAVLADINRRKTTELIRPLLSEIPMLAELPNAVDEIARKAADLRLPEIGNLGIDDCGFFREFEDGVIFWSRKFGAETIRGVIWKYYQYHPLHFPIGAQGAAAPSPFGTEGIFQKFEAGAIYASTHGAYYIQEPEKFENEGGSGGWLGFPIGEEEDTHPGQIQRFEGGTLVIVPPNAEAAKAAPRRRRVAKYPPPPSPRRRRPGN